MDMHEQRWGAPFGMSTSSAGRHDDVSPLDDARYDAIVVWCEPRNEEKVAFDVAITAGPRRGDVVTVVAPRSVLRGRSELDAAGVPCVLVVEHGEPLIEW